MTTRWKPWQGKWVAVDGSYEVIASGDTPLAVIASLREQGLRAEAVFRVAYPAPRHPVLEQPVEDRPPPEICPGCGHRCWACGRCGWRLSWDAESESL